MTLRRFFYALLGIALLILGWFVLRHHDNKVDHNIASVELPPEDAEKLIVNERQHTITIVKRGPDGQTEVEKKFLPPAASFEVGKTGQIKVNARTWGTELSPSGGILYGTDTRLRGEASLSLFYIQRFEFSLGVGVGTSFKETIIFPALTYNVYGSAVVGLYVDNHKEVGALVGLKF